jgi:hypothetical protein
MNFFELLQKLSYGPLAELAIGGTGSGSVPTENIPKLAHHTNDALIALHTRFPLRLKIIDLETVDGVFEYHLRRPFALTSGSTEINKYIKDSNLDPFLGDVLKVNNIVDAATGFDVPLNKRGNELSWFVSGYDSLRMFYPVTGAIYKIEYRARHAALPVNPSEQEQNDFQIQIPPELENALVAHIAAGVYGSMSMEGSLMKSQGFMATFENEVALQDNTNTWDQHHASENHAFYRGGWV